MLLIMVYIGDSDHNRTSKRDRQDAAALSRYLLMHLFRKTVISIVQLFSHEHKEKKNKIK